MLRKFAIMPGSDSGAGKLHPGLSRAGRMVQGILGLRGDAAAPATPIPLLVSSSISGLLQPFSSIGFFFSRCSQTHLQSGHVRQIESQLLREEQSKSRRGRFEQMLPEEALQLDGESQHQEDGSRTWKNERQRSAEAVHDSHE